MFKAISLLGLCLALPLGLWAQADSAKFADKTRHLEFTLGLQRLIFRDFATSPLFYQGGSSLHAGLAWHWQKANKRSFWMRYTYDRASPSAKMPSGGSLVKGTGSNFNSVQAEYRLCYALKEHGLFRFWLGGNASPRINMRTNSNLFNNATSIDFLINLMASGRVEMDVSRKEAKERRVLGIFKRKTFQPKARFLSFDLDIGLLNLNSRPGYTFANLNGFNGSETSGLGFIFDRYTWQVNGWRAKARLEYRLPRSTGNEQKWAYVWEVAHAPGRYNEPFQMAMHQIQYILVLNLKK